MPRTFALFMVGAVAICGAPPLNGFSSELLLYVGLLRAAVADSAPSWAWAGFAVPALAMIGALAVAGFVKVAGVAFGGAPRSEASSSAHDPGGAMLAPMIALAAGCLGLGLLPGAALPLLQRAVAGWDASLALPPLDALLPFGWISAAGVLLLALVALAAALFARDRAPRAAALTWDCGYAAPTPRMQYVDASFAETLVGLFDWAVRSRRRPPELPGPFPPPAGFRLEVPDAVLDRAVLPLVDAADRPLARMRALQSGPVQMYLLYVLLAVVGVLLVAR
jgi:hydrogenase-4 component B